MNMAGFGRLETNMADQRTSRHPSIQLTINVPFTINHLNCLRELSFHSHYKSKISLKLKVLVSERNPVVHIQAAFGTQIYCVMKGRYLSCYVD